MTCGRDEIVRMKEHQKLVMYSVSWNEATEETEDQTKLCLPCTING